MDVGVDRDANELACEMYRSQVCKVVEDPVTAAGLMPRGYPIGCKRPVVDTGPMSPRTQSQTQHTSSYKTPRVAS